MEPPDCAPPSAAPLLCPHGLPRYPPSPRAAAATHPPIDGLQLERCLLLARFVDGPKMSAPLLACALSPELGLELACRGGESRPTRRRTSPPRRYSDEAVIRAVYLRMASARVLIHVLGERLDDTSYNSTRAAAIDGGGSGGASGGAGGSDGTMPRSAPRSLAMHAARAVLSTLAERLEAESRGEATGKGDEGGAVGLATAGRHRECGAGACDLRGAQ